MSSSEAENFDLDDLSESDYESEDFAPKKKAVCSIMTYFCNAA